MSELISVVAVFPFCRLKAPPFTVIVPILESAPSSPSPTLPPAISTELLNDFPTVTSPVKIVVPVPEIVF